MDGTPLRPGGKVLMSVTKAKFEQKGTMYSPAGILFFTTLDRHYKKLSSWLTLLPFICKCLNMFYLQPFIDFTGQTFLPKKIDKRKKKKLQQLEHKMLGWGKVSLSLLSIA